MDRGGAGRMDNNGCDVVGGVNDVIGGVRYISCGNVSGDDIIDCGGGIGEGEELVDSGASGGKICGGEGRSDYDAVSGEVGDLVDGGVRWEWSGGLGSGWNS